MFWRRPNRKFMVTLDCRGRHPYLRTHELDYLDTIVDVEVVARDWNDAAKIGLQSKPSGVKAWMYTVRAVRSIPGDPRP